MSENMKGGVRKTVKHGVIKKCEADCSNFDTNMYSNYEECKNDKCSKSEQNSLEKTKIDNTTILPNTAKSDRIIAQQTEQVLHEFGAHRGGKKRSKRKSKRKSSKKGRKSRRKRRTRK